MTGLDTCTGIPAPGTNSGFLKRRKFIRDWPGAAKVSNFELLPHIPLWLIPRSYLTFGGIAGPESMLPIYIIFFSPRSNIMVVINHRSPWPLVPAGTLPANTNNTLTYYTAVERTAATNVVCYYTHIDVCSCTHKIRFQWTFDINSNIITVQWTNPDGCKYLHLWLARHLMRIFDVTILNGTSALPTTYLFTGNGQIYAGGDPNSFAQFIIRLLNLL